MQHLRPDVSRVLGRLKDFQRASVDHVFRRLYTDADAVDRFLLADEVGLGKTHVARGVIARALEHLWEDVPRLDVVYLCSNAEIASQNISRLWLKELGDPESAFSSRITLLPLHTGDLKGRKVNFVSFTPGTSFDLRSRGGIIQERALLYVLLEEAWGLKGKAPLNLLQGDAGDASWKGWLDWVRSQRTRIDAGLKSDFLRDLENHPQVQARFQQACERFARARERIPREDRELRNAVVGELRRMLARSCIKALEPDLIILDEFQRFRHLLSSQDEVAQLAQDLFSYVSATGQKTKVLMLSATPYKMYTQAHESEENHYGDFLRTTRFLLQSNQASGEFERELAEFRKVLQAEAADPGALTRVRSALERRLRRVMCRTERLGVTPDRNGMLVDRTSPTPAPSLDEVRAFRALDALCQTLEVGEPVEYWKSAPYPLNFMDRSYQLKRELLDRLQRDPSSIAQRLSEAASGLLSWKSVQAYEPVDAGNSRLRALMASSLDPGGWKLLWLPPALPYYPGRGVYADPGIQGFTKTLVFSAWQMVPRAVSALASYEAERRMVRQGTAEVTYEELRKHHRAMLRFARESATGRLTGMPLLTLFYPSPTLATQVDPLALARTLQSEGRAVTAEAVLERAAGLLERLLEPHLAPARARGGAEDEAWYWAAPLLLDQERFAASLEPWLASEGELSWRSAQGDPEESTHFTEHVTRAAQALRTPPDLGRPPADLLHVLTKMAVASPAVSMLRSLGRRWPEHLASPALLGAAALVAMGFRGLFNQPEVTHLLRGLEPREPYWERVLDYCVDGNLQSVLDEYVHMLGEQLPEGVGVEQGAARVASDIQTALSLRTVRLDVHDFELGEHPVLVERGVRCRYAVRFGDGLAEEGEEETREDQVRIAFNSPFRPFILASTSVGQEGLDFHPYCHAIHHWNLPTNPVDLEQREGRIHRFKGHVIRKNLAVRHGIAVTAETGDPWAALFAQAVKERSPELSDLVPYWIFEGPHKLERHVPLLPFSRDHDRFAQLKHSLALYRLVFGQPRQEDLLRYLQEEAASGRREELLESRIDLSPLSMKRES
jgi:hypothetical protein